MSKVIADMLAQSEKEIKKLISTLEDKNGHPSHDVRLLAGNIQKTRAKLIDLNLDPNDTTAEELYHALLVKFRADAVRFDEHFGVSQATSAQKVSKAVELVNRNVELPERWVLKSAAAKKLLKQHPPKKLMKTLHYRSIDSLLKRKNIAFVYLSAQLIENPAWQTHHTKLISALDSTAFEPRIVQIIDLSDERLDQPEGQPNTVSNHDYGTVGVWSIAKGQPVSLLSIVISILEELSSFGNFNKGQIAGSLSPCVSWWLESDSLITAIDGQHISFNLKDLSDSSLSQADFSDRDLGSGQKSFMAELISRYQNQLKPAEDLLPNLIRPIVGQAPTNQPALEYAEEDF